VSASIGRRSLLAGGLAVIALPGNARASELFDISSRHGIIDFAIGNSAIFRTTGSFKAWQGKLQVDDANLPASRVDVTVDTGSIQMLDQQQTSMLKSSDFFDVERFPEMVFHTRSVTHAGGNKYKVLGEVTLRGITRPMELDVTAIENRTNVAPGNRAGRFTATGSIKRSEFGMTKYIDLVGDTVDISIRAEAWR
jgi:polyisoprenoid-binding protein YceI